MESQAVARPPEKDLYEKLWRTEEYRQSSPGERMVPQFLLQAQPSRGTTLVDLGCGTGRASLLLALPPPMGASMRVTMVDFTDNCLDEEIKQMLVTQAENLKFVQADLTKPIPVKATYGFCSDVMEHIPPEDVNIVLDNCLMAAQHVFFAISTIKDMCGVLVGHSLHLTVRSYEWWLGKFKERDCVIHWSQGGEDMCGFYVTAWTEVKNLTTVVGSLNTAKDLIVANVKHNVSQYWQQVTPHSTNDIECMLIGGGSTLSGFEDEIRERVKSGVKLVTMNGTYNWAIEHGLTPDAQIIVDARPFNARFTKPVLPKCTYLMCSQCDPSVLEGLPKEHTYLWHTSKELHGELLDFAYDKKWWWVPGGSTVLLRAIPLLRMLGYHKFHLYGCDSCVIDGEHHAYAQKENDGETILDVALNVGSTPTGRLFRASVWQLAQAQEFIDVVRMMGEVIDMQIHGDGLLAYIIRTGAEISTELKE